MSIKSSLSGPWPFWITGAVLAFLGIFMLYLFDDALGMSDGMLMIAEFCKTSAQEKAVADPPPLDWQTGFLGGIFIGAIGCAFISGKWKIRFKPENTPGGMAVGAGKAILTGFCGGFLVMLGLQLSGDSFFGQWISAMQLSAGSWIFLGVFIATSIITSVLLARRSGGKS